MPETSHADHLRKSRHPLRKISAYALNAGTPPRCAYSTFDPGSNSPRRTLSIIPCIDLLNGVEEAVDELQVAESSLRNGVTSTQLIWRETGAALAQIVNEFFAKGRQLAITPYRLLVVGVPGQTAQRDEVARYLAPSFLMSRISAAIFPPLAAAKHLAFDCTIDPQLADGYVGDRTHLHQIVLNLVSDAIKFTGRGSVTLDASPTGASGQAHGIEIVVRHTGIGIAPEGLPTLFDVYVRTDVDLPTLRWHGAWTAVVPAPGAADAWRSGGRNRAWPGRNVHCVAAAVCCPVRSACRVR